MLNPAMRPEILFPLFAPVASLKGVGSKLEPLVQRAAGPLVRDLLFTSPSGIVQRPRSTTAAAADGQTVTLEVTIASHEAPARRGRPWRIRAFDEAGFVWLVWFKGFGPHLERAHPPGARRLVSGKVERFREVELQMAHPDYMVEPERAEDIPAVETVYPDDGGACRRARCGGWRWRRSPARPSWTSGTTRPGRRRRLAELARGDRRAARAQGRSRPVAAVAGAQPPRL
jgi:ATP-dependent DNA helicase RecG